MWNYASLSKWAHENGGPEKAVEMLISTGKRKMIPWIGIAAGMGVAGTLACQKTIQCLKKKKELLDTQEKIVRQEVIQGIKTYDATHSIQSVDRQVEDGLPEQKKDNPVFENE